MKISRSVCRIAVAALGLALAPASSFARSYWVKAGGGALPCTHATLQAAIDAAQGNSGNDTIYLVGVGPFPGPVSILGGGITIVGGVPSCGATGSTQYSTLQAPSGKRPMTILMGESGLITLRRLILTTSPGPLKTGDGGGLWFAGSSLSSDLILDDSWVVNNGTLNDGGGIFVSRGHVLLTRGSLVSSNRARNGGGIACVNGGLVEVDSSSVAANTADSDGGGIYAPDSNVRIGGNVGLRQPSAVANNIAGNDGGGLYLGLSRSSDLGEVALTSITGNQAQRGGGIFLEGAGLTLHQAVINLNTASQAGGGIYVTSGGLLMTLSSMPLNDGFPMFTENTADEGAALYADGASTEVALDHGTFYGHDTTATGAALVAASGDLGLFHFRGVTLYRNLAPELFAVEDGAPLTLQHASVAVNTVNRLIRWDGSGPGVWIANSAFAETEPFFSGVPTPQVLPQLTCVISQLSSLVQGMPPGTDLSQVVVTDPQFVAPERGDLHLRPQSPGVDLCAFASDNVHLGYDRDHNVRGFDEPFRMNNPGQTFDAGADEVVPFVWDDFESGSLAQHWTHVENPMPGSGNNVQITTGARLGPLTSSRGLQLTLVNPSQSSNPAYVYARPGLVPGNDSRLDGTLFLDPQGLAMSSSAGLNNLPLLILYERNSSLSAPRLSFALVRSAADRWSLETSYWPSLTSGRVVAGSAFFACAALPCGNAADWRNQQLELQWRGGDPAHLTVWRTRFVNGVPDSAGRVRMLSLDLPMPGAKIEEAVLGTLGFQPAGTFGQIFFDEISFTH